MKKRSNDRNLKSLSERLSLSCVERLFRQKKQAAAAREGPLSHNCISMSEKSKNKQCIWKLQLVKFWIGQKALAGFRCNRLTFK